MVAVAWVEEFGSDLGDDGDELGTLEKVRVRVRVLGEERQGVGGDDEGFAGPCVDGEGEDEEREKKERETRRHCWPEREREGGREREWGSGKAVVKMAVRLGDGCPPQGVSASRA